VVLLRSHDHFGLHAEFDPATAALRELPSTTKVRPTAVRGAFSKMLGRTLVLWNDGRVLRLVVDRKSFDLTPDVRVVWEGGEGLVVHRADEELFRWDYPSPSREQYAVDPTFSDDQWEDFDFGLYIANVSKDLERRVRAFDVAFDPSAVLETWFAIDELSATLAEAFGDDEPAMMAEIRRWWWRWDEPRVDGIDGFCSFCDVEGTERHRIEAVHPTPALPRVLLCAHCRATLREGLAGKGTADADRILADAVRAVRAVGAGHSEVLAAELERRKALAYPRNSSGSCDGCGNERGLARGPGLAFCHRCVSDR